MLNLSNDILIEIIKKINISTILNVSHISHNFLTLVIKNFKGNRFETIYCDALSTSNEYAINLLYYAFKIEFLPRSDLYWVPNNLFVKYLVKSGNLDLIDKYNDVYQILQDGANVYNSTTQRVHIFFKYATKYGMLSIIKKYVNIARKVFNIIDCAAIKYGQIEILEWCIKNNFGPKSMWKYPCIDFCPSLDILKCCLGIGRVLHRFIRIGSKTDGILESLKWLKENNHSVDIEIYSIYPTKGHLEIIKWFIENGLELNDSHYRIIARSNEVLLNFAIEKGYGINESFQKEIEFAGALNMLKFCVGRYFQFNGNSFKNIVRNQNVGVLKWCIENGCPLNTNILVSVNEWKFFECIMKFDSCRKLFVSLDPRIGVSIVMSGNVDLLKLYVDNGYPLSGDICRSAARSGSLVMIKYCRAMGFGWNEQVCADAARCGNLDLLKYCRNNGCKWDSNTTKNALLTYKFKTLKWAIDNGCSTDANVREIYEKYLK